MKYQRARHTAWRTIADETVLLDLARKRMYGLNPAAAYVWLGLDAASGLDELLPVSTGNGEPAFGEREVMRFLDELVTLGLADQKPPTDTVAKVGPRPDLESTEQLEPPAILWREEVEQIAGTCAMLPSQNPLCTQVPFS